MIRFAISSRHSESPVVTCHARWLAAATTLGVALLLTASLRCYAAGGGGHAPASHSEEHAAQEVVESPTGYSGIDLGQYTVRTFRSVTNQRHLVHFTLHAVVKNEDLKRYRQLITHRKIKVRDQVIVATRLVAVEDYDDPDLKKLRRRILLRLRRTLPELPIDDIYVSEFRLSVENL